MTARLWTSRRELVFDLLPVGVLLAMSVAFAATRGLADDPSGWIDWGIDLTLIAGLLVRRRWPVLILAAGTAVAVAILVATYVAPGAVFPVFSPNDPWLSPAAVVAAYTAAAHAPYRPVTWVLLAVLTGVVTRPWEPNVDVVTGGLLLTVMPALLGLYIGARRRLEDALRERAERAEREQHLMAEHARADERARLAAEMHDVVTHRVSLMVLQAGALTVSTRDEGTRSAADELRATGCQALDELRDLVGVLQATPGEAEGDGTVGAGGRPSALDLRALAAEAESVGGEVELAEEGDATSLSPAVARTAYRIVQEALTNVRKHAPGAAAQVRVRYGSDRVRLVVHNGVATQPPDEALVERGSHRGLAGLRQRVELVGGTFEASADGAGGFVVNAVLPAYVPTREVRE